MTVQHNISLKPYNTFGIDVIAKRFISVNSFHLLNEVLVKEKNVFLLSGGSNILLTKNIDILVIWINIKGICIDHENENDVHLTVNAGEDWHEFVLWCISQNYGGIENLSLIPGRVGTSPIQNIGAYGVEVKDVITKVEGIEIASAKRVQFSNTDCQFGYRNSIFKNELKNKVVLTSVSFKLTKQNHQLNTNYGAIKTELANKNINNPSIKDVSEAVIKIRQSKLPDPKIIGNCGSFFKNPIISVNQFKKLQQKYTTLPFYLQEILKEGVLETTYKIPAGWLIETAGYKGKRFGRCGVHKKQALVLVNLNNASGIEVFELANKIKQTIFEIFQISLEIEVNIFK